MATVQLILKEKVEGLGSEADVVNVRRGYASNFLVPSGKAYPATKANLRHIEALKKIRGEREAEELKTADRLSAAINKTRVSLELATGETGKAFGSVTTMDIAQALADKKIKIDRHQIALDKPIKKTGDFDIEIKLHADVTAKLRLKVKAKASAEEEAAEDGEDTGRKSAPTRGA